MRHHKLDFLVIGAQKCATSWLYYCLDDHPDIHLPSQKKDNVYLGGTLHEEHGHEWFLRHLGEPSKAQYVGDISVNYLFDPRAPAVIRRYAEPKIIACLRDPIDRLRSAYYWKLRQGIVQDANLSRGVEEVLQGIEENSGIEDPLNKKTQKDLLTRGEYDVQVKRYTEFIEDENILLIPFAKIKEEEEKVLRRAYRFIGVDSSFRPSRLSRSRRPKRNSYLPLLLRFERDVPNNSFFNYTMNLAHQAAGKLGVARDEPEFSSSVRAELHAYYDDHTKNLWALIQQLPASRELWESVEWVRRPSSEVV